MDEIFISASFFALQHREWDGRGVGGGWSLVSNQQPTCAHATETSCKEITPQMRIASATTRVVDQIHMNSASLNI